MQTYRAEIIVTPPQGYTPVDVMAAITADISETSEVTRHSVRVFAGLACVVVEWLDESDQMAVLTVRSARRAVISAPADVASLTTGRGQSRRRITVH
jgi:hypothetical protein